VLDAHKTWWDILLTARYIHHIYYPIQITMPIAGYIQFIPLAKQFIEWIAWKYEINFIPVYRRDEYEPVNYIMRILCWFYPKKLNIQKRELANQEYILKTLKVIEKPNNMVIVAPYGSPLWFGGKVKYGVKKLIESSAQKVLSQTVWSKKKLKFVTHLSKFRSDLPGEYEKLTRIG